MSSNVFLCCWSELADGRIKIWVKNRPELSVVCEGCSVFDQATEALIDRIVDEGETTHPVIEFDSTRDPSGHDGFSVPLLFAVHGDERFDVKEGKSADALYEESLCKSCGGGFFSRGSAPLSLSYATSKVDGAFCNAGLRFLYLYSETFLDHLTQGERSGILLRQVKARAKKRFYELIGPVGPEYVLVKGLDGLGGWKCAACSTKTFRYQSKITSAREFIAKSSLPPGSKSLSTVGGNREVVLCFEEGRWRELVGSGVLSGIVKRQIGVVGDDRVERDDSLLMDRR